MGNQNVAVFISLYRGLVDEVRVFGDRKRGEDYHKSKVDEAFGSEEAYQEALQYGADKEYQLHDCELE